MHKSRRVGRGLTGWRSPRLPVVWHYSLVVLALFVARCPWLAVAGAQETTGTKVTLAELRERVRRNESLAETIKFRYAVELSSKFHSRPAVQLRPGLRGGGGAEGPRHMEGVWAQDGPRFYDSVEAFADKQY